MLANRSGTFVTHVTNRPLKATNATCVTNVPRRRELAHWRLVTAQLTLSGMVLYTCGMARHDLPGPIDMHPCAKAIKALDRAGISYELRTVSGLRALPGTVKNQSRDEVRARTGQSLVPALLLDDGTAIHGSATIVSWAYDRARDAG